MPKGKLQYEPHIGVAPQYKGQAQLHEARAAGAKRIVAQVGRRWGKGRFAIGDMMANYQLALQEKRGPELVPPWHAGIIVNSYPQGRQPWHEILSLIPREWKAKEQAAEYIVWMKDLTGNWGGRAGLIEMKSAFDGDSLQGFGLDYLWTNESQDISDNAYEIVLPTTRSHGVLGWQYNEGIPSLYPEHWFERSFSQAQRSMKEGDNSVYAFHATSFDNPLLSEEHRLEITSDKEVLSTAAWERLYMAKYNANAGFFRGIDSVITGDVLDGPIPGRRYVGGLDPGWTNDPTVLILMDMEERRVVMYREWDGSFTWRQTREELKAIHQEWGLQTLIFDASSGGGKAVEQDLNETELPVEAFAIVGERRKEMLERLAAAIDRGSITIPPTGEGKTFIRQLRAMQMRRTPAGGWRLQVPSGEHDDYIFAAALCLSACNEAWSPSIVPFYKKRNGRYIQTQREADGGSGPKSLGGKSMKDRRIEAIRQRAILAGVDP